MARKASLPVTWLLVYLTIEITGTLPMVFRIAPGYASRMLDIVLSHTMPGGYARLDRHAAWRATRISWRTSVTSGGVSTMQEWSLRALTFPSRTGELYTQLGVGHIPSW